MVSTALAVVTAALAVAAVIGLALVRVVPAGHCGVVIRAGRVVRTRPSGLLVVVPFAERVAMVLLHPRTVDPLCVRSVTRDGVEIRLVLSVLWRVTDPATAVHAAPDASAVVADVVERGLHHMVAELDLAILLRERESFIGRLPVAAFPIVSSFGAEVVDVDLLDAEVRVGPELLRLLA